MNFYVRKKVAVPKSNPPYIESSVVLLTHGKPNNNLNDDSEPEEHHSDEESKIYFDENMGIQRIYYDKEQNPNNASPMEVFVAPLPTAISHMNKISDAPTHAKTKLNKSIYQSSDVNPEESTNGMGTKMNSLEVSGSYHPLVQCSEVKCKPNHQIFEPVMSFKSHHNSTN